MARVLIRISLLLLLFKASTALAQTESTHVKGPNGLESWTLPYPGFEKNKIPGTLKIARNGKIIAKFRGDPFIWRWIFLDKGTKIAFETGPFHFSMACVLANLPNAKELERVDCFKYPNEPPQGGWSSWIDILETSKQAEFYH